MNFWCALVFSREFRRQQSAKSKHIFEIWCECVWSCAPLVVVFHRVHWSRDRQAFDASGPAGGWLWSSCAVFPAFCPLSCFMLVASLANMALFRVLRGFLEGFIVRMNICMGLVLCLDCVAFVRVWS